MSKIVNIVKDRDELNVYDRDGSLLVNIRIAGSSHRPRADLSVKTDNDELRIIRERIAAPG